jgi:DHA3 family macrolide efflux protein-like MFS transporter
MILNFFISPAMRLMPMLVREHFQGGALELGWLQSAWGLGLVTGGVLLSIWGGFKRRIVTALMGIAGLGVGALIVGLVPSSGLLIAVGALFFGAVMNALCNGSLMAVVQSVTPPDMQGRFFTVLGSLTAAMMPLGMAIGGPVADAWGTRVLFVVAGIMQIAVGLGGFLIPVLMQLEDHHRSPVVASEEPAMVAR